MEVDERWFGGEHVIIVALMAVERGEIVAANLVSNGGCAPMMTYDCVVGTS